MQLYLFTILIFSLMYNSFNTAVYVELLMFVLYYLEVLN